MLSKSNVLNRHHTFLILWVWSISKKQHFLINVYLLLMIIFPFAEEDKDLRWPATGKLQERWTTPPVPALWRSNRVRCDESLRFRTHGSWGGRRRSDQSAAQHRLQGCHYQCRAVHGEIAGTPRWQTRWPHARRQRRTRWRPRYSSRSV